MLELYDIIRQSYYENVYYLKKYLNIIKKNPLITAFIWAILFFNSLSANATEFDNYESIILNKETLNVETTELIDIKPRIRFEDEQKMLKNAALISPSIAGQIPFSPLMDKVEEPSIWFRPYAIFENVNKNDNASVKNTAYGGLVGIESELIPILNDFEATFGVYGGYSGSHQTFDDVSFFQNGGFGGLMGTIHKDNFYTGITLNAGASNVSYNDKDNFIMFFTGIASRTGYNFKMRENKLIIQPNYVMSYTFVATQDYTDNQGVTVKSDPLHIIQIAPGIVLFGNFENQLQPFLSVNVVGTVTDNSKIRANAVAVPELVIHPYVQYGVGIQKKQGENFSGFFQTLIRNGGRNGVALLIGLRWEM